MKESKIYDLEDRLVEFAGQVISIVEGLPENRAGRHIAGQLIRSGTSPAPNYGEAQSAESRKDFIHKMKIALKELRETNIWLRLIERQSYLAGDIIEQLRCECNELISIFVKSIKTAERNLKAQKD